MRRLFYAVRDRAGVRAVRAHDLRHGNATQLLLAGEDLKRVSAALGHSRIGITADTYMHMLEGLDERAAAKIEALLFAQKDSAGAATETRLLSNSAVNGSGRGC